ncbi:MAG: thiamine pyrophosphate-binding protein, partial [Kiloniellales bacterium]|nr:thiamine pyrophosphate-binding protein [Kiloniellales bacterium]
MSKPSCAEAIVNALENEGVEHVFIGPPGEHVVELYDALIGSKKIEGILATNEYTLSFMADGYSRATSRVGVFTIVPGPGVTNALTGIAEAYTDSTPLVGIISDVRSMIEESFQLHQIPNLEVLAPVTKKTYRISDPAQVFETVANAFETARSGEPGPVLIEIPCDLYALPCPGTAVESRRAAPQAAPQIDEVVNLVRNSKQVGLYVGRGCSAYANEVMELVERLQAPVASSVTGRGILADDHPLSVGFGFGSNGSKIARQVFND